MTLRRMLPKDSTPLREAAGIVVLLSWSLSSLVDRVAASTLSRVVGSEPIDPGGLSSWREVVS